MPANTLAVQADVTDPVSPEAARTAVHEKIGPLALVSAAGVMLPNPITRAGPTSGVR